jgi:hypothetical protein
MTEIVTLVPSQRSRARGRTNVQGVPHSTVKSSEQIMAGGVVSTKVTIWLQVFELPHKSLALHVLVTVNRAGQKMLGGLVIVRRTAITTFVPSQLS